MSNIRVDVGYTIKDGTEIKFRSPVDCSAITGLIVYYPGADGSTVSKVFAFADAHGNNVGDIDHLFAENVVVKVILDVTTSMAFVQNADTNAYLEAQLASKRPNTWLPTIADIGAAPAGYGLGDERCTFVSLDEITKNGYYLLWLDTANGDFSTGQFVCHAVVNANTNSVHLSGKHSGGFVHRDKVDGVWQPWEWVNPPMIPGVEYRTTERYNGKPVYTMLVDCLNGPNASQKMVTIPSTNAEQYIYCSLFCDAPAVFPLGGNDHTTDFQYGGIFLNQIKIVSQVDASTDHFYAIVKYTKTTD